MEHKRKKPLPRRPVKISKPPAESWSGVSEWYVDYLYKGEDTYQKQVVLPNLLRLMDIRPGESVLDLACGPGFFSREFQKQGARVIGADISPELIAVAQREAPAARFVVSPADSLPFLNPASVDKAAIILAIQNIENVHGALKECGRVLVPGGKLYLVMNHPAFRVPKHSAWGWDEKSNVQYRRVERYLSELREKIQMHPGADPQASTVSFHRPLQFYFKALRKHGFFVRSLEEWVSHKKSDSGPRAPSENRARTEIPLFLCMEAVRQPS